jgi:hypothetical protein
MIIVDDVMNVVNSIKAISDPQARSHATSAAIVTAIASSIYYIMLGSAIIVLGRRIINATMKAWKESRRDTN